ncbi:MAG: metallophosphoesterase, partial [Nitrospirae bacterium]
MTLFLLTFFLIYAGTHVYAFLRTKAALAFGAATGIYLAAFMLLMIFAPIIVRQLEKYGLEISARLMSYTGYIWLAILFLFFSSSLAFDLYRFLVYAGGLILRKDLSGIGISVRLSFFISFFLAVIISFYGYFEARNIITERIVIKTSKISKETGRLKIVQISDVHIGLIIREERLKRILEQVRTMSPDILVSTGDLVDGQINGLAGIAGLFKEINPRYGKFAITGNHEFYAGLDQALAFTREAGFLVLRGNALTVEGVINIAGVDDPQGKTYGISKGVSERELLSELQGDLFTLLLKHRPVVNKAAIGLFDLQLSGHVHKGQIFP